MKNYTIENINKIIEYIKSDIKFYYHHKKERLELIRILKKRLQITSYLDVMSLLKDKLTLELLVLMNKAIDNGLSINFLYGYLYNFKKDFIQVNFGG